nr:MAG TPA: hypothetical protein [Caudoviricetes sp.]
MFAFCETALLKGFSLFYILSQLHKQNKKFRKNGQKTVRNPLAFTRKMWYNHKCNRVVLSIF